MADSRTGESKENKEIRRLQCRVRALTILCGVIILLGALFVHLSFDGRLRALENQSITGGDTGLQAAIDFLQDQMQFVIWGAGAIIAGIGAALTFFGYSTKKSIEENYDKKYHQLMELKSKKVLENVFDKKILFLYQTADNKFSGFFREILSGGYNADLQEVSDSYDFGQISDAFAVVYRVSSREDTEYKSIGEDCEKSEKHCILFCPDIHLDRDWMNQNYNYISSSNQIAKMRESLYSLLYLAP